MNRPAGPGSALERYEREEPGAAPAGERGVRGQTGQMLADALTEPWFSCLRQRLPGLRILDSHTHLGSDPDGSLQDTDELLTALAVVDGRAVAFPLSDPRGYRAANDLVLDGAADSAGRLVPFCRVDPRAGGLAEAERAVERGAQGIKLHPRAEGFSLADSAVQRIADFANRRRLPIVVHAGRGIPMLGREALTLAARYREAPIILAHAAITDLAWIWREARAHPNLYFDTAWWNVADLLALFALIPPGRILFASDTPYGRTVAAGAVVLRAALASGLSAQQVAAVAGAQMERLLAGAAALDLGPPPQTPPPAPGPLLERLHTLLVAGIARMTTGQAADEYLQLAKLGCRVPAEHPDARVAASVCELLERYERVRATDPPRRGPRPTGIHLVFVAAAIARTPELPVPVLPEGGEPQWPTRPGSS